LIFRQIHSISAETLAGGESLAQLVRQHCAADLCIPRGFTEIVRRGEVDISNSCTGFVSLANFNDQAVSIGNETTLTVSISSAIQAALPASANPTQIICQVGGGSSGNPQTFYIDISEPCRSPNRIRFGWRSLL
jgi:hypothetical protein